MDPTVSASAVRDGEALQALALSLPAETAYVTPSMIELRTAWSIEDEVLPPRLMFATAGAPAA